MKKANITISFEHEKLKALKFYAGKKDADLRTELEETAQKLYEKYVPAQTREYIESMSEPEPTASKTSGSRSEPTSPLTFSPDSGVDNL